ncbi:Cyclic nucleotide-binding protein [Pseudocohnilembus persalinus]|uniref:Cyclic nucleotide-binding protein n=1 Tax=Pseudocohnilembus persalinus TaxID=266149 RepID=A0A0V0QQY6_PSEPJ|nr:Cyclic nucleotide-binding protein [Pseudocohnilembus persalinus]|eukprot:KRX04373.1 Cyclic nucleotide-binding protein [Pseudocohnilembus persalinus]
MQAFLFAHVIVCFYFFIEKIHAQSHKNFYELENSDYKIFDLYTIQEAITQNTLNLYLQLYLYVIGGMIQNNFCFNFIENSRFAAKKVFIFYPQEKNDYEAIEEFPTSLKSEIKLQLNNDFIQKVNLFNLGEPEFLLTVIKNLYPTVCTEEDIIIRCGQQAEEFFIIKKGEVEVLAPDNQTVISVLREGAYFGEIGLIWKIPRTVTIKARTNCIFLCLNEKQFDQIMDQFPDYKSFLMRVGRQRMKTTEPEYIKNHKYRE